MWWPCCSSYSSLHECLNINSWWRTQWMLWNHICCTANGMGLVLLQCSSEQENTSFGFNAHWPFTHYHAQTQICSSPYLNSPWFFFFPWSKNVSETRIFLDISSISIFSFLLLIGLWSFFPFESPTELPSSQRVARKQEKTKRGWGNTKERWKKRGIFSQKSDLLIELKLSRHVQHYLLLSCII